MKNKKIVILGGGITGLTLARELSTVYKDKVVVLEKESFSGGLASTLSVDNFSFDLGSHRLHRNVSHKIVRYIEDLIKENLLKRERRGKLYFKGRYITYPPNISNFLESFSSKEIIRFIFSYLRNFISLSNLGEANFEDAGIRAVGKEIYEIFYKGYARKLWGKDPKQIAADGMSRRKTILDFKSLGIALFRRNNYFLYPKYGIGTIARNLEENILKNKGKIIKGVRVKDLFLNDNKVSILTVEDSQKKRDTIDISLLISTIPIDDIFSLIFKEEGNLRLKWRGVRLLYILLEEEIKNDSETYYFPNLDTIIGRVSDIKKYSPYLNFSAEGTFLTIEVPSSVGDKIWDMDESEILNICLKDLIRTKILKKYPKVSKYFFVNLDKAYPIYELRWRERFFEIYNKLYKIDNLFVIGRKGLFLHCNIDHCIIQGLELADFILKNKGNNKDLWNKKALRFFKFCARD